MYDQSVTSWLERESSNSVSFTPMSASMCSSTFCCCSSTCSRTRPVCGSTGLSSDGALQSRPTRSSCMEPVVSWERSGRSEKSGRFLKRRGCRCWNRRESGSLFSDWKEHLLSRAINRHQTTLVKNEQDIMRVATRCVCQREWHH
jgi:hypothetical protein